MICTDFWDFLGRIAPILSALCTAVGLAVGWIVSARKSRTKRERKISEVQDAIREGVLALLRAQLVDAYERHVTHGGPLTVERRHEIDRAYEAYRALGGNGTIERLYQEICNLPTHIVGEKED